MHKVYIASKLGHMEGEVSRLRSALEARGYTVPYDWTEHPVPKPFYQHPREAHAAAEAMAYAVMSADVLILLTAPNGLGMHIETGGALVAGIILAFIHQGPAKKIYIVGKDYKESVFYYHNSVTRVASIELLLSEYLLPIETSTAAS